MDTDELNVDEMKFDIANENLIRSELFVPNVLYLDIALFRDIWLGTLLTFIQTQEEYDYVLSCMEIYKTRHFNDFSAMFPKLDISTKDILNRMNDATYHSKIYQGAPITPFLDTITSQLALNMNHSAVIDKKDPILIRINSFPLTLHKMQKDIIGLYFMNRYSVNVEIICTDPRELSVDYLLTHDEFYIYNLNTLLENKKTQKAFSELKFIDKRFYIARFFGFVQDKRDIHYECDLTKSYFDILVASFLYIDLKTIAPIVATETSDKSS